MKTKTILIIAAILLVPAILCVHYTYYVVSALNQADVGSLVLASYEYSEKGKAEFGLKTSKWHNEKPLSPSVVRHYLLAFRGDKKDIEGVKDLGGLYFILKLRDNPPGVNYRLTSFFIDKGFDIDYTADHGKTALLIAIQGNREKDVAYLLSKGADISIGAAIQPLSPKSKIQANALEFANACAKWDGKDRTAIIELLAKAN